ncbi:hypothetical protein PAXRUDRAFT_554926 [Paxillus rubicundulus Ve08.2h10]|uniref:Uncharacterized protein n=1 Tax=Paxillus rubicundulus Ve08.2h10 TaxID=930991 RepID=A0A0D0DMF1_9AGAM|nr:hypothetical protein PAXRUDRAFT_554926 [Paxillus rubicundulus Ve08.2h10]
MYTRNRSLGAAPVVRRRVSLPLSGVGTAGPITAPRLRESLGEGCEILSVLVEEVRRAKHQHQHHEEAAMRERECEAVNVLATSVKVCQVVVARDRTLGCERSSSGDRRGGRRGARPLSSCGGKAFKRNGRSQSASAPENRGYHVGWRPSQMQIS